MEEIAKLQEDIASRRCTTAGTSIRAFLECPFPALCSRVMGDLDQCAQSEAPFAEHVSKILDAFVCIQELAEALALKKKELKDLCSQLEAHQREREKIRIEQQELAEEAMRELESTTDCLLNLHSEKVSQAMSF